MRKVATTATPPLHGKGPLAAIATTSALALVLTSLGVMPATAAPATHTIAAVQGAGAVTGMAGATVSVDGIITADHRGASGYRGFFIQTPGSGGATDATPGASDAIFVFLANADPAVALGDTVSVTGTVSEFNGLTQISATNVGLLTTAAQVTDAPAVTALAEGTDRESLEGMLVAPTGTYRVASSHQLFNFGTLWLSPGDLAVKSTETTDVGPAADAIAAANRADRLLLDDAYNIQITNAAHAGEQPYFDANTVVRNGDAVVFPVNPYVLSYGFNDWRLQPTLPITDASPAQFTPTFEPANPRPAQAPAVGGDFQVGAFNVFNYFTTLTNENSQARGADTAEAFTVQKAKIIAAINGLGAEVIALQEIENSVKLGEPTDEALADLVAGLNAAAGAGTWDYVRSPADLADPAITDFITNAIIFQPAAVTPVGASFADIDETVWDIAREPIAQTFEAQSNGSVFTVIANHFKSKSGDGVEPADGQGQFNAERVEQANRLKAFVDGIVADPAKSEDVLLIGDFNAYAEEDPIQVFTSAGYVDLVPAFTDDQYTYSFDGELGSLDHIIATASMAESITGAGVWSINSPEWSERGYEFSAVDATSVYRSSDHDPSLVGVSAAATAATVEIEIVTTNDFHGRLEAGSGVPGAAQLGGMVEYWEALNANTTFVGAGDMIGASTFTSFIQNDQPTIDVLNAIGLDASSFGNHEFDQGRADVDARILDAADWPYLAANLYDRATNQPAYDEYFLQSFDGVDVAFIGAVTEDLNELVSPAGIASLEIRSVVTEVNRVADYLTDGNDNNGEADVLVLLVHEGAATPALHSATDASAFGQIVTGVSPEIGAIVSGHTHLSYDHEVTVAGMDRPRLVISAGQYGANYGHLDLTVDAATHDIMSFTAEVLPVTGFTPDAEVASIVADAVAVAAIQGGVSVGQITESFYRAVQTPTASAPFPENRGGESTLGNFVADVHLWAAQELGAEIALMNPGGLRADLLFASSGPDDPDGNLTIAEAAAVQPFANTLTTFTLTGAQLEQVLEEQWQPAGAQRPFLKLGVSQGLEYTYDPTAVAGERITAVYLNEALIDPAGSYQVVANSFLAAGGDNFATLAQGTDRADSGRVDLQSMVDYFEANPTATPPLEQRAVGVHLAAAGPYAAGDQLTVNLSSLVFSRGGPSTGVVMVRLGETVLGESQIDGTIVDTTDEGGRASVTGTIPAGLSGPQVLTITVVETGASVVVPIQIEASAAEPIAVLRNPTITGVIRVGKTVSVNEGRWSVRNPQFGYQWNRDGQTIEGATSERYRLVAADAGTRVSVTVTATAQGYTDGAATSESKVVRPASRGGRANLEDLRDLLSDLLSRLLG
ncbi:MAG: multifunctional nuclease/2,3-cyclic-nucleotide [Homoserinimonas sp.]|nr:multifunctional nuclease/2,3-cyclic-nucleotide [Homoserinimonas sp.]